MIDLQEIRLKHSTDLKQLLEDLLEEQFKLKMQAETILRRLEKILQE